MRTPKDKLAGLVAAVNRPYTAVIPQIIVETGTFRGQLTVLLPEAFRVVHTIELSSVLYKARPKRDDIDWIHGDSADVLPRLSEKYPNEPVLWLLDAHYFPAKHTAGAGTFPLWRELQTLRKRHTPDIVAVDDVHTFGKKRGPQMPGWEGVSPASLSNALGGASHVEEIADMCVLWRSI
jgi:hypothetical protein